MKASAPLEQARAPASSPRQPGEVAATAARLHRDALVCDMMLPWLDLDWRPDLKESTLPRFAAAGVDFVSLTIGIDSYSVHDTIKLIARERAFLRAHPDKYRLVETAEDILAARKAGQLAVGFNFQGTDPLDRDISLVEVYYALGVRSVLLAYNLKNSVGDGCQEESDGGLSRFGRQLIKELNRVGMFVDLSHTGYRTCMEAFEVATAPVIFTHSNPLALHDHPRNIRDEQIAACAQSGGVIGINGIGAFLGPNNSASSDLVLRAVDYVVQRVGPEHVGFGLDYVFDIEGTTRRALASPERYPAGGGGLFRFDLATSAPEQYPLLTEGMLRMGYAETDVRLILGENWLRVARQVWK